MIFLKFEYNFGFFVLQTVDPKIFENCDMNLVLLSPGYRHRIRYAVLEWCGDSVA